MAPLKRGRKCKIVMKDSATQTNTSPTTKIVTECLQPTVVLVPLNINEKKVISNEEHSSDKTTENSSKAFNVPNNYSVFVQPINNKENASSTLLTHENVQAVEKGVSFNTAALCKKQKRVKFLKPGPLCYKRKVLLKNDDLSVPMMMDEVISESPQGNLETIFERNTENTPNSVDLLDSTSSNPFMKEMGIQTLTDSDQILLDEMNLNTVNDGSDTPIGRSSSSQVPENIRLQFEGVTTVITTRSTERSDDAEASDDDSDTDTVIHNRKDTKNAKYIKIKASTVHIHNHFYKT